MPSFKVGDIFKDGTEGITPGVRIALEAIVTKYQSQVSVFEDAGDTVELRADIINLASQIILTISYENTAVCLNSGPRTPVI